jgi:hypothetical protein
VIAGGGDPATLQDPVNDWITGLEAQYPGWFFNIVNIDYRDEGQGNNKTYYALIHIYFTGPVNPEDGPTEQNI